MKLGYWKLASLAAMVSASSAKGLGLSDVVQKILNPHEVSQSLIQQVLGHTDKEHTIVIDTSNEDGYVHYSELHPDDLPVNMSQYSGELVIRVNVNGNKPFREFLLKNKHTTAQSAPEKIEYKVWAKSETKGTIDLQISEGNFVRLIEKFSTNEYTLDYEVIIEDLAQTVFESYPRTYANSKSINESLKPQDEQDEISVRTETQSLARAKWLGDGSEKEKVLATMLAEATLNPNKATTNAYTELFFKDYRPLESIDAWLQLITQTFPGLVNIEEIGSTYEHRTYQVVHLQAQANSGGDEHDRKKTIVITGGVHAREWISISSVCYTLYGLLQHYTENPDEVSVLDKLDFLFIPVLNPDGYAYSWSQDRLWRKNRQETVHPKCFGIDIDHSYDYHWTKSSDWACGEEYSGEVPFEAIESKIWDDFLNATNHNHDIMGYIDLHSYAQEVLYPYAYSCSQQPRDEENLIELAYGISKAIRLQSGKNYQVLPACIDKDLDLLPDLGSGSALDFMYHNKAFWAYQLKLRDSGSHGFLLPGKFIEPVGKEVLAGINYFISFIMRED